MREVGERLRRAREERGLSLEQIQGSTKIRLRHLEALEEGNFDILPGEVYARGFIQNFAAAVNLDPHEILDLYDRLRTEREKTITIPAEKEPEPRRTLVWWQPVLVGTAIILLAALIFLGKNYTAPPAKKIATSAKAALSTPKTARQTPKRQELRLVFRCTARCWLQIRCDGRIVFDGTLDPITVKEWRAKEVIQARLGNAGGIEAELNGENLGIMGMVGENLTREFRLENLRD